MLRSLREIRSIVEQESRRAGKQENRRGMTKAIRSSKPEWFSRSGRGEGWVLLDWQDPVEGGTVAVEKSRRSPT